MHEDKQSVSALVEEWRRLRSRCQSDLDAADISTFDTIAELYGKRIEGIEHLIADTDPEDVDDIAAMLDVILNSLELEAMDPEDQPLRMVRRVRNKIHLVSRASPSSA